MSRLMQYYISRAKADQIDLILKAAMKRKEAIFPEWEIIYLALPKDNKEKRVEYLERLLELERQA